MAAAALGSPAGADVFKVISEHRRGQPSQWLILALGLFLVITAGAVLWVSTRNAASTSSIRLEAQKELLIADMASAVQVEAQRAAEFAGQIPGMGAMQDGDSMESMADATEKSGMSTDGGLGDMTRGEMSEMGTPGQVPGGLLADDPELLVAIGLFEKAAGSLRQLTSDSEHLAVEAAVTAHNDFVASLAALDGQILSGEDAMSFYHGNTQVLEAGLRAFLQDLQLSSNLLLQSAVDDVGSTAPLLRWAVPLLLLAGITATVYLIRLQTTKRQVATLEHLIEAKSEFIATVSHELRTPLTAVLGFADLLQEAGAKLTPSDRAQMLAAIAEQSEEINAIVEDLLAAAGTDIGELTVAAVPVNMRAQTAQVLETLDQNKSIAVHGQAPRALGDPARVRQILRNLFTNARRYGGEHVSVELGSDSDDQAWLVVTDDGDPIPVHDRERIFEAYQRAHNQPGLTGSIGLGLAVSRRLARLMGGDLTYRHQDGQSIFELSLPIAEPTKLESHQPAVAPTVVAAR